MKDFIFKISGQYFGFIDNGNIFTWNGRYVGWLDGGYAWDVSGQFRGEIKKMNGHTYILRNKYALPPLPKEPKSNPLPIVSVPVPQSPISPISPEIGWVDGF